MGVGEETVHRLRAEPGKAQLELRRADAEHYVERPRPLALGSVQPLPVPGQRAGADAACAWRAPARCAVAPPEPGSGRTDGSQSMASARAPAAAACSDRPIAAV